MLNLKNISELFKNKFMVQATKTELQSSENFKLQGFWDEKATSGDKASIQQEILKINVMDQLVQAAQAAQDQGERGTVVQKDATSIGYEQRNSSVAAKDTRYENAPTDDINEPTSEMNSE